MLSSLLVCILGAAVIVVAGFFLTKFADAIADLTGWGSLLVGSILLAGATSLPEVSVDTNAILIGQPNLAAGDLFGSCLCNLLILAVLDMSHYSRGRMLSPLASAHALSGMMSIVLCSIAVLSILTRPTIRLPIGLGIGTFAILLVYVAGSRLIFYDQRMAARSDTPGPDQAVLMPAHPEMSIAKAIIGFIAAGTAILLAAPYLTHAADELAERSGLGRTYVGTTLVALSTSLPELVASVAALEARSVRPGDRQRVREQLLQHRHACGARYRPARPAPQRHRSGACNNRSCRGPRDGGGNLRSALLGRIPPSIRRAGRDPRCHPRSGCNGTRLLLRLTRASLTGRGRFRGPERRPRDLASPNQVVRSPTRQQRRHGE